MTFWSDSRLAAAVVLVAGLAVAQETGFEELELRVSSLRPNGSCVVDRGSRDLVQIGDRVILTPRNGKTVPGTVLEVEDRTALVELADPNAEIPVGTKGQLLLPRSRRVVKPVDPEPAPVTPEPDPTDPDEWKPGMPLLSSTRPPRPSERPSSMHGRLYGGSRVVRTLDTWDQSYITAGTDVKFDNLRGDGGTVRFHGEYDHSTETSERTGSDLRVYDFSYEHGGTRFDPTHWQLGRFLQREMPEFGVLDGGSLGYRSEGGDRYGLSLGYLPELDEDMESLADLQLAVWYLWNQDAGERVTYGFGYQKSWHRFKPDRDLFVLKARYLPLEGWDLSTTLWIDVYTGSDNLKNESFELSRGNLFLSRRWANGGGIEVLVDHEEYPELRRRELPQSIQPQTLIDAHQDRVSLHAYTVSEAGTRWFSRTTGWIDEEREGGSLDLGFEANGMLQAGARSTIAIFAVQGLANSVMGTRIQHGGTYSYGRLDLLLEVGLVHHESQPSDRDDLLQYRFGGVCTTDFGSGWDGTLYVDSTVWDEEYSFGVGIYIQRLF